MAGASMGGFLEGPFGFSGRISRARYWKLTLLYLLGYVALAALLIAFAIMVGASLDSPITIIAAILSILVTISMTIAIASIGVRRLHDRGKNGWWLLLYYVVPSWIVSPGSEWYGVGLIYNVIGLGILIWVIVDLGCLRGEAGSNAFGPNPLT
jgi:uncharacterized membrane protein YhaH (DUF805 family)